MPSLPRSICIPYAAELDRSAEIAPSTIRAPPPVPGSGRAPYAAASRSRKERGLDREVAGDLEEMLVAGD
jgi:hypothetical protein